MPPDGGGDDDRRRFPRPMILAAGAVGLAMGILGVGALREATLSTHHRVDPHSQIELVVFAEDRGAEPGQSLFELVDAQVRTCRLEVTSDVVGEIVPQGDQEFRAVLRPTMDETNRRQFRGCLEDWLVDHIRLDVVSLRDIG
jgi:hypothetical protein